MGKAWRALLEVVWFVGVAFAYELYPVHTDGWEVLQVSSSPTIAGETDARLGKGNRSKASVYFRPLRVASQFCSSTLHIAWREICSLPTRIRWASRIAEVGLLRGDPQIQRWVAEALIPLPERRQSDCIAYIEKIRRDHPFLSNFDICLVAKSWIAGSEWGLCNSDRLRNPENL